MDFILWISRRLRVDDGANTSSRVGVRIAIAGVALSLIILEFTIAIVLGFKNQISDKIMGFDGQISVLPAYDYNTGESEAYVQLSPKLIDIVKSSNEEARPTLKFSQPGILKTDTDFSGIYLVGYDSAHDYGFERSNISEGELPDFNLPDNANKVVLSEAVANSLQLSVGDNVYAYFFINDAIKSRKLEIAALYNTGFSDYDKTIAFASMPTLQKVASVDSLSGTQITLNALDQNEIEIEAATLQTSLINAYNSDELHKLYPVDNVKHTGAIFFNWLDLLDTNVVVIFILMACVAGFTLISSMFIIILDRIPTIGLLRAMGSTKSQIRLIFVTMLLKIVGWGLLIGNIVGIGLLLVQKQWHVMKLDPDMYYLPHVPVEFNWTYILLLNIGVVVAAWLILILPSRLASNISPAKTMRFE